jgi:hypothetical protein
MSVIGRSNLTSAAASVLYGEVRLNVFDERPCLTKKFAKAPALLNGFPGVKARFKRIFVTAPRARSPGTAVHAAAQLAANGR